MANISQHLHGAKSKHLLIISKLTRRQNNMEGAKSRQKNTVKQTAFNAHKCTSQIYGNAHQQFTNYLLQFTRTLINY